MNDAVAKRDARGPPDRHERKLAKQNSNIKGDTGISKLQTIMIIMSKMQTITTVRVYTITHCKIPCNMRRFHEK